MVVMSGDVGCWCALFGTLVGVFVLSVMWLELESVSEISSPRWSSVYECQSVECAFTSPVIIFNRKNLFNEKFSKKYNITLLHKPNLQN